MLNAVETRKPRRVNLKRRLEEFRQELQGENPPVLRAIMHATSDPVELQAAFEKLNRSQGLRRLRQIIQRKSSPYLTELQYIGGVAGAHAGTEIARRTRQEKRKRKVQATIATMAATALLVTPGKAVKKQEGGFKIKHPTPPAESLFQTPPPSQEKDTLPSMPETPKEQDKMQTVPEPYKTLFTQAAAKFNTNPQYLAALFLSEHDNHWVNPNTKWKISPGKAYGPFQFLLSTWNYYKQDGNGDGKMDVENLADAAYAAAAMAADDDVKPDTLLGDIEYPWRPGTILYAAAKYCWGIGNMEKQGITATSSLDAPGVPEVKKSYLRNIYELLKSSLTKGANDETYLDVEGAIAVLPPPPRIIRVSYEANNSNALYTIAGEVTLFNASGVKST